MDLRFEVQPVIDGYRLSPFVIVAPPGFEQRAIEFLDAQTRQRRQEQLLANDRQITEINRLFAERERRRVERKHWWRR